MKQQRTKRASGTHPPVGTLPYVPAVKGVTRPSFQNCDIRTTVKATTDGPEVAYLATARLRECADRLAEPSPPPESADFDIRTMSPALKLVKSSVLAQELGVPDKAVACLLKALAVPTLDYGHGPEFSAFAFDLALFGRLLPGNRPLLLDREGTQRYQQLANELEATVADPALVACLLSVASLYYNEAIVRTIRDRIRRIAAVCLTSDVPASITKKGRPKKWVRVASETWDKILASPLSGELHL